MEHGRRAGTGRDGRRRDAQNSILKRIQTLQAAHRSPGMIVDQLVREGHALQDIKRSIVFLPLTEYHGFSELFKTRQHQSREVLRTSAEKQETEERRRTTKEDHHLVVEQKEMQEARQPGQYPGTFFFNRLQLLVVVGALLLFFVWLQLTTQASLFIILVAFFPTLITLSLAILVMEKQGEHFLSYLWIVGILFIVLFYFLMDTTNNPLATQLELGEVAALNFILTAMLLLIFNTTMLRSRRYIKKMESIRAEHDTLLKENRDLHLQTKTMEGRLLSLEEYAHAIEDKCKAINFVIGRVYKDKHGGSPEMRNRIKIDPLWYNQFSTVKSFNAPEDKEVLRDIITRIQETLHLIGQTENKVFGPSADRLRGLERDPSGRERVIEVLAKNDKDPVKTYFESAKTFCRNALAELEASPKRQETSWPGR
ncbi:MAG: hypothetical protein GXP63_07455 [DPANN group archaeon]|nr:hypothetical protein [DPANN group archaeon]